MKYTLFYTKSYNQRAAKFLKKHPQLEKQYQKTLEMLELNPFYPTLRLHKLKGRMDEIYSVSINMMYRITLEFLITDKTITLINIGDHAEVY